MKTKILAMAVTGIMAVTAITVSAQQPDKKAEAARKEVAEDQKELAAAKKDSASDYQKFRNESELKITKNKKDIAELKARKANENKEVQVKYNKKVSALEQKNNELRKKMEGYKESDKSTWASFKHSFNHELDELGKSISAMAEKNMKKS